MSLKQKLLIIVGPTAVGKTQFGIKLAQKFNGGIINADSIQVYKGLDIISGKDLPPHASFNQIKTTSVSDQFSTGYYLFGSTQVYLLDLVLPTYEFNVSDYVNLAIPTIEYITGKQALPMVVGGTGYYIKTLLDGNDTFSIPPNEELRNKLENLDVDELSQLLSEKNPERLSHMNESDRKNKRRLIRALEVAVYKEDNRRSHEILSLRNYDVLMIGLYADKEILKKRIDNRIDEWFKKGALEEVEVLFKQYDALSSQVKTAVGYREVFSYLTGEVNKEEMLLRLKNSEYDYVKKQLTWFRKDIRIHWFNIEEPGLEKRSFSEISKWFENKISSII